MSILHLNTNLYIDNINIDNLNICGCYARQSTLNQCSLDTQIESCRLKAIDDGYEYMIVFKTKKSGYSDVVNKNNKEFNKLLKLIKDNKIAQLYIYDVSRFMRNLEYGCKILLEYFKECNIYSVMDNKEYNNIRSTKYITKKEEFLDALNQAYKFSNNLSIRLKTTYEIYKIKKVAVGRAPIGYKSIGKGMERKFVEDIDELKIISLIVNLNKEEGITPGRLENYFNKYNNIRLRGKNINCSLIHKLSDKFCEIEILDKDMYEDLKDEILNIYCKDFYVKCEKCEKWRYVDYLDYKKYKNEKFECENISILCEDEEEVCDNFDDYEEDVVNDVNNDIENMEL